MKSLRIKFKEPRWPMKHTCAPLVWDRLALPPRSLRIGIERRVRRDMERTSGPAVTPPWLFYHLVFLSSDHETGPAVIVYGGPRKKNFLCCYVWHLKWRSL